MRALAVLASMLSALLLLGCNQQEMLEKFSTPTDQATAKAYIADLQAGRLDVIESHLDPSIKAPGVHATLIQMAGILPAGSPTSVKLVGARKLITPAGSQTNTTFEYQWGDKWLMANVAVQKSGGAETIVGINVNPLKASLEEQARFTLSGKSGAQYAILAGAILAFGLTLVALVVCVRTKGLRRKWLWIIFILFGLGAISVNWTTGAVAFQPIFIGLFSAAAMAQFYGPWTISMSVPIGAMVFLFFRRKLPAATQAQPQPEA